MNLSRTSIWRLLLLVCEKKLEEAKGNIVFMRKFYTKANAEIAEKLRKKENENAELKRRIKNLPKSN